MISVNAKITDVSLTRTGCGIVLNLEMNVGRSGCVCLGDVSLGVESPTYNIENEHYNYAAYYINKIFEVVGVDNLEEMKGKPVKAIFKNKGRWGDKCIGIQHFLDDGVFFIPSMFKSDERIDITPILDDNLKSQFDTINYDDLKISQNFNVKPLKGRPEDKTTNRPTISMYVSPVLRIIEAAQNGGDVDKCKRYAMKLAQYLEDDGYAHFASAVREKFNPNANVIVFD